MTEDDFNYFKNAKKVSFNSSSGGFRVNSGRPKGSKDKSERKTYPKTIEQRKRLYPNLPKIPNMPETPTIKGKYNNVTSSYSKAIEDNMVKLWEPMVSKFAMLGMPINEILNCCVYFDDSGHTKILPKKVFIKLFKDYLRKGSIFHQEILYSKNQELILAGNPNAIMAEIKKYDMKNMRKENKLWDDIENSENETDKKSIFNVDNMTPEIAQLLIDKKVIDINMLINDDGSDEIISINATIKKDE